MSFEETNRVDARARGPGWRHLSAPIAVRCYIAGTWMDQPAWDVNDESREVRVAFTTVNHGLRHVILDPGRYRTPVDLFAGT